MGGVDEGIVVEVDESEEFGFETGGSPRTPLIPVPFCSSLSFSIAIGIFPL
jgi:hypothetical protein